MARKYSSDSHSSHSNYLLHKMCIERDVVIVDADVGDDGVDGGTVVIADVDVGVDGVGDGTVRQAWLAISSRCSPKRSKSVTNT